MAGRSIFDSDGYPSDAEQGATALTKGLRHTLALLRAEVDDGSGGAVFSAQLDRLRGALERCSGPTELLAVLAEITDLRLPDRRLPDGQTPEQSFVRRCIEAMVPVAVAVSAGPTVRRLKEMAVAIEGGDAPGDIITQYLELIRQAGAAARFVRRGSDLLRELVAELLSVLDPLVEGETDAGGRIEQIRERLARIDDVQDLEALRGEMVQAASELVEEARSRGDRVAAVRERIHDTSDQIQLLERALADARTMANTDPLTGLGNRRALEQRLRFHGDNPAGTGVLMIDIDHFKLVNDRHGHEAGDRVLRQLGQLLQRGLRGPDRAFRLGGEEFVILLAATDKGGAMATAERLRESVWSTPVSAGGDLTLGVSISIGVSLWEPPTPFQESWRQADEALLAAKRAGRDRIEFGG